MATRKKPSEKSTRPKKTKRKAAAKRPAQRRRVPKKLAKKRPVPKKKVAPKRATAGKTAKAKTTRGVSKSSTRRTDSASRSSRNEEQRPGSSTLSRESSGLQSGDLQGLSNVESADSESVDELLEEGNAFEAGIVAGVEDSGRREGKEVRTRELPEDDVPEEYLDEQ